MKFKGAVILLGESLLTNKKLHSRRECLFTVTLAFITGNTVVRDSSLIVNNFVCRILGGRGLNSIFIKFLFPFHFVVTPSY